MAAVRCRLRCGVAVAVLLMAPMALANDEAAHALADQFARDSAPDANATSKSHQDRDRLALERKLEDDARLKADEAEMLERAKAEAEQAQRDRARADAEAAEDKAARERAAKEAARIKEAEALRAAAEKAEAKRRDDEQLAAQEAARIKEAEAQRAAAEKAEAKRRDDEQLAAKEAADRARVEAAEQRRLAAEKAESERKEAERKEAEHTAEVAAAQKRIEAARQADALRRMTAEREEEGRRLSEKLTRARSQRTAKDQYEGYSGLGNPPPDESAFGASGDDPEDRWPASRGERSFATFDDEPEPIGTRATILLALEPGRRGIRRYERTADPIVCIGGRCFIGHGADDPAATLTRARALGPGNTLGQRAGACRHSLTCIFRDVDVGATRFQLQPVDLRILRHDRRETVTGEIDRTCRVDRGSLRCARPVQAGSYRVWIVPEGVAQRAGVAGLSAAIAAGLPSSVATQW